MQRLEMYVDRRLLAGMVAQAIGVTGMRSPHFWWDSDSDARLKSDTDS